MLYQYLMIQRLEVLRSAREPQPSLRDHERTRLGADADTEGAQRLLLEQLVILRQADGQRILEDGSEEAALHDVERVPPDVRDGHPRDPIEESPQCA